MTDQSVTERKYDAILDSACTVSSREGYAASCIEDIAARGGFGRGTVYLYFKSRELPAAALARDSRIFTSKAREELESVPAFREKIGASCECAWSIAAHEDFLRIHLFEHGSISCEYTHGQGASPLAAK